MKTTEALAGTATNVDYSSQWAVRQLQVEGGLPGMLGIVVSTTLAVKAVGKSWCFFLETVFDYFGKYCNQSSVQSLLFASLKSQGPAAC